LRVERPHSLGATCFARSAFDPNAQEAIAPFRTRSVFEVIPTHDRVGLQLILNSKGALVGRGMPLPWVRQHLHLRCDGCSPFGLVGCMG
jgi:hypothetical protein